MRFENKTALITGAASGMGLLSAKCIAAEGGNVALVDVNEAGLAAAEAEIGRPAQTLS
ncbi:MAG: SDR family NAD(P)-dependent oxidoreductase, partial [Clostridia bacterium]|nr:SDR family NAD(P)-dependent oxidoreductase [Clostridia bacterium]